MLEIIVRTAVCYLFWLLCCKAFGWDEDLNNKHRHLWNILIFFIISTAFVIGGH